MSKTIGVVVIYPNRHVIDIFEELKPAGYEIDYYFFEKIPDYRANNNWLVPENTTYLNYWSVGAILKLLIKCRGYKAVFFQSLIFPLFFNAGLQLAVQWIRGDRFIFSEGARHPNRKRRAVRFLAGCFLNSKKVQHLSIGNGAAKDYVDYGFSHWRYRKFCFCEKYAPVELERDQFSENDPVTLICVGRLLERKNFSQAIEALKLYSGSRKIELVICGDGPERENLESLAQKMPANVSITFAGHCDRATLDQYFRKADIFVLTSTYEGWGVVVNHALHFGLPLLLRTTVRSGTDYLLIEGENGYSFEDTLSLTTAIERLVEDDELRKSMSLASRNHNKLWCMETIVSRLDQLIQNPEVQFDSGPLTEITFANKVTTDA